MQPQLLRERMWRRYARLLLLVITIQSAVADKAGVCPSLPSGSPVTCHNQNNQCSEDKDCSGKAKCCTTGCAKVCVMPLLTGCEQQREATERRARMIGLGEKLPVPLACTEAGEFEERHCEDGLCWCVDKSGFEQPGTRARSLEALNCSDPLPCAGVQCRMLCPFGFELNDDGCPLCQCRDPCDRVKCPGELSCHLEDVACADEPCPPIPTCKRARSLESLCPVGVPLAITGSERPFLCGVDPGKPECPPLHQCSVQPGQDYGVCCPAVQRVKKPGTCPPPSDDELEEKRCHQKCQHDLHCSGMDKCCHSTSCGKQCVAPANVTACIQQRTLAEILTVNERVGRGYVPQCDDVGRFLSRQCSRNGLVCWCVDKEGHKLPRSMGPVDQVSCDIMARTADAGEDCDRMHCAQICEYGYLTDERGCPTCSCDDPCRGFTCSDGQQCRVVKECDDFLCPSEPVCTEIETPAELLVCPGGESPLLLPGTDQLMSCREEEPEDCPQGHHCSPDGYCCPTSRPSGFPEDTKDTLYIAMSSCEKLRAKNLRAAEKYKKPMFIPKCNEVTGAWERVQCLQELGLCWCVEEDGTQQEMSLTRGNPTCSYRTARTRTFSNVHGRICDQGVSVHVCPRDLCENKVCVTHPSAVCRINPCGGCSYDFYDDQNQVVDCDLSLSLCQREAQAVVNSKAWVNQGLSSPPYQAVGIHVEDVDQNIGRGMSSDLHEFFPSQDLLLDSAMDLSLSSGDNRFEPISHSLVESKLIPKRGSCPRPPESLSLLRCPSTKHQCVFDTDCPSSEKCCFDGCGPACTEPEAMDHVDSWGVEVIVREPETKSTPARDEDWVQPAVAMVVSPPECRPDGGYVTVQSQGQLMWCVNQHGTPRHNTLTRGLVTCDSRGEVVERKSHGPVCKDPSQVPQVCRHECRSASCPAHPDAVCVADPCQGCKVAFYTASGEPVTCEDRCNQPLVTGRCRSAFPRFFFNKTSSRCEPFNYGGCEGNDNNFQSVDECRQECEKPVDICQLPRRAGLCRGRMPRWFYDPATHRCHQFFYGGCGGNENNFRTRAECESRCPDQVLCPRWQGSDSINSCSRHRTCNNASCPGFSDVICEVDPCSCTAFFTDHHGNPVKCGVEEERLEEKQPIKTKCELLRDQNTELDSEYIPTCDQHGRFAKTQCARSTNKCWCVDSSGRKLTHIDDFTRGSGDCNGAPRLLNDPFEVVLELPQTQDPQPVLKEIVTYNVDGGLMANIHAAEHVEVILDENDSLKSVPDDEHMEVLDSAVTEELTTNGGDDVTAGHVTVVASKTFDAFMPGVGEAILIGATDDSKGTTAENVVVVTPSDWVGTVSGDVDKSENEEDRHQELHGKASEDLTRTTEAAKDELLDNKKVSAPAEISEDEVTSMPVESKYNIQEVVKDLNRKTSDDRSSEATPVASGSSRQGKRLADVIPKLADELEEELVAGRRASLILEAFQESPREMVSNEEPVPVPHLIIIVTVCTLTVLTVCTLVIGIVLYRRKTNGAQQKSDFDESGLPSRRNSLHRYLEEINQSRPVTNTEQQQAELNCQRTHSFSSFAKG